MCVEDSAIATQVIRRIVFFLSSSATFSASFCPSTSYFSFLVVLFFPVLILSYLHLLALDLFYAFVSFSHFIWCLYTFLIIRFFIKSISHHCHLQTYWQSIFRWCSNIVRNSCHLRLQMLSMVFKKVAFLANKIGTPVMIIGAQLRCNKNENYDFGSLLELKKK